mgnify:CR=1 FL=1
MPAHTLRDICVQTILIVIGIKRLIRNFRITVCDGYYLCMHVYLIAIGNLQCQKINRSCIVGKTIEFIEYFSDFLVFNRSFKVFK